VRSPRAVVLVAPLLAVLALGACSGGAERADAPGTASPTAGVTPTAGAPAPASTDPTSPAGTATDSTAPASPPATGTATAAPTAAASVRPSWPKALGEPQQGDPVWAVYLGVGHGASDPAVEDAVQAAASVGYQAVVGDIACDGGATRALGLDEYDYWSGATVYFATEKQARGFAAAYTRDVQAPRAVAQVAVGCLD
jgi:hypothetical protein